MLVAAWVQAVSTVILLIVTGVYVVYTRRIIHSPHSTILKPSSITRDFKNVRIYIENIGPNPAYDVRIESILVKNMLLNEGKSVKELKTAEGTYCIRPSEKIEYIFEEDYFSTDLTEPFIIKWTSTTGDNAISIWYYNAKNKVEEFRKDINSAKKEYKKIINRLY